MAWGAGRNWNMRADTFLYTTHCHNLFYRTIQSHEKIPNGIQKKGIVALTIMGRLLRKYKGEVLILVRDTSSKRICHNCKVV